MNSYELLGYYELELISVYNIKRSPHLKVKLKINNKIKSYKISDIILVDFAIYHIDREQNFIRIKSIPKRIDTTLYVNEPFIIND